MANTTAEAEIIARDERYLESESLARRANWPEWAREVVELAIGRTALVRLQEQNELRCGQHHAHTVCCARRFAYLGMPNDSLGADKQTVITPRESRSTETGGHYYRVHPRIPAVNHPDPGTMRALIHRFMRAPEARKNNWSGWFVRYDYLWMMTSREMIDIMDSLKQEWRGPATGFVAVIDTDTLSKEARVERPADGPEVFIYNADARPDLLVPVLGPRDLSPYTIIIDTPGCDRERLNGLYREAKEDLVAARDRHPHTFVPLNDDKCWPMSLDQFRALPPGGHPTIALTTD